MRRHAGSIVLVIELSICGATFGCHGPNPHYLGVAHSTDTGDHVGEESTTDTEDDETTDSSTDTSTDSETTETETETDTDTADTDTPNPSCGDKNPDFGEFCFKFVQLLGLIEVQSLATADFNGDGKLDIAVARKDDVRVLFGDGTGSFALQVDLPEPNSNYFGAAAGDLDGDEIADLVVSGADNDAVLVYRSLGGGSFAEPVSFAIGDRPRRLALLDINGDSVRDLAVAIQDHDTVEVLLGDGAGGFEPKTAFASGGDQPVELSFGLFDHGSAPDLVVGNVNGENLAILLGIGSGQFEAALQYPLAGRPRSTVVADLDLDGHLDVAAALEDRDRVQILHGDGLGGLIDSGVELPVGDRPMGALAEDFNLDGLPDLLVINRDDASVSLLFGASGRSDQFMSQVLLVGFDGLAGMSVVISGDLNNDGVADVIIGGDGVRAMISDP